MLESPKPRRGCKHGTENDDGYVHERFSRVTEAASQLPNYPNWILVGKRTWRAVKGLLPKNTRARSHIG